MCSSDLDGHTTLLRTWQGDRLTTLRTLQQGSRTLEHHGADGALRSVGVGHDGAFHKRVTLTREVVDGRVVRQTETTEEGREAFTCVTDFRWTTPTVALGTKTCGGEPAGRAERHFDDQGRLTLRLDVEGTTPDNEWITRTAWTFDARGEALTRDHLAPFVGQTHQTWTRDDTGRLTHSERTGDLEQRITWSPGCAAHAPTPEPW